MRIVIVSTVFESTPPQKYGGIERVVAKIADGMAENGHEVYLFASGKSKSSAKLIKTTEKPLFRYNLTQKDYRYFQLENLIRSLEFAKKIKADIIHFHELYPAVSLCRIINIPCAITIHFNIDKNFIGKEYARYLIKNKDLNYISISNSQRRLPLHYVATIYNGTKSLPYCPCIRKNFAFWVGRITKDKGTAKAVKIARRAGIKLVIAGKLEKPRKERNYFKKYIKPYIDNKQVIYVGEVGEKERNKYMREAQFFINPIDWAEPFGLVITESMAQGTPVISFANGSPEEIIDDGENGLLINEKVLGRKKFIIRQSGVNGMVQAAKKIIGLSPEEYRKMSNSCVKKVREKFSDEIMIKNYEKIYRKIIKQS